MQNGNGNHHMRERERLDFSKIRSSIQIPNLIEVQKNSYQRFLQMDLLPSEREDGGLQSVFTSVFPIQDFRGLSQLDFVDYSIGNWECKCGNLKGLHHLRATCRNCGRWRAGGEALSDCRTCIPSFRSSSPRNPAATGRGNPESETPK